MNLAVSHRGPDGSGLWEHVTSDGKVWLGLGHTRLSILDLSDASAQPFATRDGRYALTFNGEIYNYVELRTELAARGHVFETEGDTEVLLRSLIHWGNDALPKLRGMFAFVFVDLHEYRIVAARDEFGIKPLYMRRTPDWVAFSSEIKQIAALSGTRTAVYLPAAVDFLLYGITDHGVATHFQEIDHVRPGECVEIDLRTNGALKHITWRNIFARPFRGTYEDACTQYRELFLDSLSVHMRSDVEVGSCLSGGLDSSAIVGAVGKRHFGERLGQHTFTATSENKAIDERAYADAVIAQTHAQAHFVQPSGNELWKDVEKLVWHQDEPFGSTSIYAQWKVFELAKRVGIKVMLDGQGADEQLGGYNSFINTHLGTSAKSLHLSNFRRDFTSFRKAGRTSPFSFMQYLAYSILSEKIVRLAGQLGGIGSQNHMGWINPKTVKTYGAGDPFRVNGRVPRSVRDLSTDMIFRSNLPMLLRFEDRNSMAHGVEARVPFVDGPLMRFTLGLPAHYLLKSATTKPLLRDSLAEFLPPKVLNRQDKIGFQTAEELWFKSNPVRIRELVSEGIERLPSLFTHATYEKVERVLQGNEAFNAIPWRVANVALWAKVHGVESTE